MRMGSSFRFVALLGIAFAAAGFILIVLGFDGAASQDVVSSQIPYLISGGLGGLALVVLGIGLALVHEFRQGSILMATRVEELTEALAASRRVGPTEVPDGASVVASRSSFHRPDCHLVSSREDVQVMSASAAEQAGLTACRICEPQAAAS